MPDPFVAYLFREAPLYPLQRHMLVVEDCVAKVPHLFDALWEGDQKEVHELRNQIFLAEGLADHLKNEIGSYLCRSPGGAFDRRDLLALLGAQDSIADGARDLAGLLGMREMEISDSLKELLQPLIEHTLTAIRMCFEVTQQLDQLLGETDALATEKLIGQLQADLTVIETDLEVRMAELGETLFERGSRIPPVAIFIWYEMIQKISELTFAAVRVGESLRSITAA
jgi:predicted phosphate transport protein (TIGR00153 family)